MREYKYTVREYRYGNTLQIWVGDEDGVPHFSRTIHLIWNLFVPATERIRRVRDKAQRKADKLNHSEMYINHDLESVNYE